MYNEVFSSIFYSVKHDSKSLTESYDQDILKMIYSDGIDLAISLENVMCNYESFKSTIGKSMTELICHRIHLVEQLFVVKQSLIKTGIRPFEINNQNYEILYN
jgi:hypothetical protein